MSITTHTIQDELKQQGILIVEGEKDLIIHTTTYHNTPAYIQITLPNNILWQGTIQDLTKQLAKQ